MAAAGYTLSASCALVWTQTIGALSTAEPKQRWLLRRISENFVSLS
jgi:hypothetical protein